MQYHRCPIINYATTYSLSIKHTIMAAKKKSTKKKSPKKIAKKAVKKTAAKKVVKKAAKKKVAKKAATKKTTTTKKVATKVAKKKTAKKVVKKATKKIAKKAPTKVAKVAKPTTKKTAEVKAADKPKVSTPKEIKPRKLTAFDKKQYQRLLDLRDQLIDTTSRMANDTLKSQDGSDHSGSGEHTADAGSDAYDRDIALNILSKEQDALYEIEEAIGRLERGVYGYCEISGEKINQMRLEYIPFCRLTIDTQERWEKKYGKQRFRRPDETGYTGATLD